MIYIEPAPYIMDLVRVIRQQNPDVKLQVLYISKAVSQQWNSCLDDGISTLLPENKWLAIGQIFSKIYGGSFNILHLAGWGHPVLLASLMLGIIFKQKIAIETDTQLPIDQRLWKRIVKKSIYPLLFTFVDLFLPGGSRQNSYLRYYHVPQKKIRIAQMTMDVKRLMHKVDSVKSYSIALKGKWGLPEDSIIFLYIGRLDSSKGGIHDLLLSFSGINETMNAWLLIAGDGELRQFVEMSSKKMARMIYMGRVKPDDIHELYAIGDVLVLPSHSDNWGLVVNEAMCAGLPVIASDRVGCIDDLVKDGETGLVVPARSIEALEKAMQFLLEKEDKRKEMGLNGRNLISSWTLENEAEIIVEVWKGTTSQ